MVTTISLYKLKTTTTTTKTKTMMITKGENEIVDSANDDEPLVASVNILKARLKLRYGDHSKIRNRSRRTLGSVRV